MVTNPHVDAAQLARERRLVDTFYRAFRDGDLATLESVLAPDWDDIPLAPGQAPGPAGLASVLALVHGALPDLDVVIHDLVQVPGRIAVRAEITGTHQGPLFGIEATGKPVRFRIHEFHDIAGDRIRTTWHLEDWLAVFQQIGRFPGQ